MFLAGKLSYFVNELLEDKRETGFYETSKMLSHVSKGIFDSAQKLNDRYRVFDIERAFSKKEIGILEGIALEHSLIEKAEAERFLGSVIDGNNEYSKIWKKLGNFWHYMLPFLANSQFNERFNKHAEF